MLHCSLESKAESLRLPLWSTELPYTTLCKCPESSSTLGLWLSLDLLGSFPVYFWSWHSNGHVLWDLISLEMFRGAYHTHKTHCFPAKAGTHPHPRPKYCLQGTFESDIFWSTLSSSSSDLGRTLWYLESPFYFGKTYLLGS